jgi:hypothetical protein
MILLSFRSVAASRKVHPCGDEKEWWRNRGIDALGVVQTLWLEFPPTSNAMITKSFNPRSQRPFRNGLSGVQLIEQRLRFPQIERIETFGEPAADRSKQFARLLHTLPWSRQRRARPDQTRLEANRVAAMVAHSVARLPVAGRRRACRYQ